MLTEHMLTFVIFAGDTVACANSLLEALSHDHAATACSTADALQTPKSFLFQKRRCMDAVGICLLVIANEKDRITPVQKNDL